MGSPVSLRLSRLSPTCSRVACFPGLFRNQKRTPLNEVIPPFKLQSDHTFSHTGRLALALALAVSDPLPVPPEPVPLRLAVPVPLAVPVTVPVHNPQARSELEACLWCCHRASDWQCQCGDRRPPSHWHWHGDCTCTTGTPGPGLDQKPASATASGSDTTATGSATVTATGRARAWPSTRNFKVKFKLSPHTQVSQLERRSTPSLLTLLLNANGQSELTASDSEPDSESDGVVDSESDSFWRAPFYYTTAVGPTGRVDNSESESPGPNLQVQPAN